MSITTSVFLRIKTNIDTFGLKKVLSGAMDKTFFSLKQVITFEPGYSITYKIACAPSVDSEHSAHLHSPCRSRHSVNNQ